MIRAISSKNVSTHLSSILRITSVMPQKVQGRMFSLQQTLPRLPVPKLENTLEKYLNSVRPLLTDEEFKQTAQVVEEFKHDPGPSLQKYLQNREWNEVNWLSDWWKNTAYLEYREPVVVNVSPGILFPKQDYADKEGQLRFAAKLIAGILDYKVMIDNQSLEVEYMGKKPLCMDQFFKILNACRIPGRKVDEWHCFPPDSPHPPRHVIIIHNHHIFSMDVLDDNHVPLSIDQIYAELQSICKQSDWLTDPIGLLTTENRTIWAEAYNRLKKDGTNRQNFDLIHRSIVVVCLDNFGPDGKLDERSQAARLMLHGGGSQLNSGNRWFDKTVQFVVGPKGVVGLNYEHTTAEGPPVISLADHAYGYSMKTITNQKSAKDVDPARKLVFNLDKHTLQDIENAKENLDSSVNDVDLNIFKFSEYGKNFPKSQKMSPDSFIQNAIQLTYYRMYGEPAAHYETASLRQFQLGRTDTIRSCSIDSLNFCKAFVDNQVSKETKAELLRKAVEAHKQYTNEAIQGKGIDRHLLGLKLAAIKSGQNVPNLHMDMAYNISTHFKISTSQVPSKFETCLVFGPVVPDGYGVCYNPQENQIIFGVSAFDVSPKTDSKHYIKVLNQTLSEMRNLFQGKVQANL